MKLENKIKNIFISKGSLYPLSVDYLDYDKNIFIFYPYIYKENYYSLDPVISNYQNFIDTRSLFSGSQFLIITYLNSLRRSLQNRCV